MNVRGGEDTLSMNELLGKIEFSELEDGVASLEVCTDGETVWLSRQQMALLIGRDAKTIDKHVGAALREELSQIRVVANFAITATDGKTYQVEHYNLGRILSVGYRILNIIPNGERYSVFILC